MSAWVRQIHRFFSIAFTLGVIAYMAAMSTSKQPPPGWLGLFALVPLILLLITGLVMFAQPYLARRKA